VAEVHTLPNGRQVVLGRKGIRHDSRTLHLADYLQAAVLPAVPPRVVNSDKVNPWPLFLNNQIGDCTAAGVAHLVQLDAALVGTTATVSDADVLGLYEKTGGYNPTDPSTDQGAYELDVLNYWRHNGFAGQTPVAFAAVNPQDMEMVRQAINLFGSLYIGLSLPRSAQAQDGGLWDVDVSPNGQAGTWGGHAVLVTDYDTATHELGCITWGAVQCMTESFWARYCDEAWAILSDEWRQTTPSSAFDFAGLEADLAQIGHLQP
jgi:hypothetical protein